MNNDILSKIAVLLEKRYSVGDIDINKVTPMQRIANALLKGAETSAPGYLNDMEKIYTALLNLKEPGGSSVTVEPLNVTVNDTYTAPSGKAYSPVNVNVPSGGGDMIIPLQSVPGGSATVTLELKDGLYWGDIDWIDHITFDPDDSYLYIDSFEVILNGNTYSFNNNSIYLDVVIDDLAFFSEYLDNGHFVITIQNSSAATVEVSWSGTNVYKPSAEVMSLFPNEFPVDQDDH